MKLNHLKTCIIIAFMTVVMPLCAKNYILYHGNAETKDYSLSLDDDVKMVFNNSSMLI